MTTTMTITRSTTGEIWEIPMTGLICLNCIDKLDGILDDPSCYDEIEYDSFIMAVSDTAEVLDRTSIHMPCSAGLTISIQNIKHQRYESYHIEFERG